MKKWILIAVVGIALGAVAAMPMLLFLLIPAIPILYFITAVYNVVASRKLFKASQEAVSSRKEW